MIIVILYLISVVKDKAYIENTFLTKIKVAIVRALPSLAIIVGSALIAIPATLVIKFKGMSMKHTFEQL